ncbi:DUF6232 family protein [Streptomyces sp. NPDC020807]|uniref:DUF6232 family protein n=1 Tax=Streptomyces sp. NPDC020807 TaxID=3155119 RepID=UPI0033F07A85
MASHGATPPVPPRPPKPPAQPTATPAPPPSEGLVISKRLLWVHGGAYPLENIVRVHTFVLTPRRAQAVGRFLKRAGITAAVIWLCLFIADGPATDSDMESVTALALLVGVGLLVYYFSDMASVAFAADHHVLAVETNGRSTALVTGKREYLEGLVREIAEAIDEPNAQLTAWVGALNITNYDNYYFGDSVNMYGGTGNTGVSK